MSCCMCVRDHFDFMCPRVFFFVFFEQYGKHISYDWAGDEEGG